VQHLVFLASQWLATLFALRGALLHWYCSNIVRIAIDAVLKCRPSEFAILIAIVLCETSTKTTSFGHHFANVVSEGLGWSCGE